MEDGQSDGRLFAGMNVDTQIQQMIADLLVQSIYAFYGRKQELNPTRKSKNELYENERHDFVKKMLHRLEMRNQS